MKRYSATITIQAPAEAVWKVLVDTAAYPQWDPGMVRVEGRLAPGEKVKFFTKMSPDRAFAVKVTAFDPGRKLVLTGGLPFGLFKSERTHTLTADDAGHTAFHTEEVFSGPLLPIFGGSIPDLTDNFRQFAAGLKERSEQNA